MQPSIFRQYSPVDPLRSDRSAGDRQRHRQKVRDSIRNNIADILAEESIIGRNKDKIIKVPVRSVKEYRFVYGENTPGVGQGDGDSQPGQVVGRGDAQQPQNGNEQAGNQAGVDYYETDITLDELIDMMFEDLALPNMERKMLRQIPSDRISKRQGYRHAGIRVHLDKKRTVLSRVKRRLATKRWDTGDGDADDVDSDEPFPFRQDDLIYRHRVETVRPDSNAVVICIMDTSGSMDTVKKYIARSFFFLLYQFVSSQYQHAEVVFVAHHSEAQEVTEEEFFHKGESGGTNISSGYLKALEVIRERYHPSLWNIYAFHCSDGDNFTWDNTAAVRAAEQLCAVCNLFGYGEIKPTSASSFESSMMTVFRAITADNFKMVSIPNKDYVWPSFAAFLVKERISGSHVSTAA